MRSKSIPPPASRGFTLLELLVTVSLAAIILAMGVPSFTSMIANNRITTTANDFLGAMALARSEAIKRGQPVTLCKADFSGTAPECDSSACSSSSGDHCWEQGWLVFSDVNSNGTVDDDNDTTYCEGGGVDTDCIIRVYPALPKVSPPMTLRNSASKRALVYQGVGALKDIAEGATNSASPGNSTFRLCLGSDLAKGRAIPVNATGRAVVQKNGEPAGSTPLTTCP